MCWRGPATFCALNRYSVCRIVFKPLLCFQFCCKETSCFPGTSKELAHGGGSESVSPSSPHRGRNGEASPTPVAKMSSACKSAQDWTFDGKSTIPLLEWLLERLWLAISDSAVRLISAAVESAVQEALGRAVEMAACTRGPRPEEEDPGRSRSPLQFRRLRAETVVRKTDTGELVGMLFRGDMEWQWDMFIDAHAGAASVGLLRVRVRGAAFVELVGMCSKPPLFKGVRFFLANPPDLDLDFEKRSSKLFNAGGIKKVIAEVMSEEIARGLVAPNGLGLMLDPWADSFRTLQPCPLGVLKITIFRAEGLPAMDYGPFRRGTSDPYAVVICGAERYRSPTQERTLSPNFKNYTIRFVIDSVAHKYVRVELWDEDVINDDFLGGLCLPINDILAWGTNKACHELADSSGRQGGRGRVWLGAEWRPLALEPPETEGRRGPPTSPPRGRGAQAEDVSLVYAGVYSACQLPKAAKGTTYWVVAHCTNLLPGPQNPQRSRKTGMGAAALHKAHLAQLLDVEPARSHTRGQLGPPVAAPGDDLSPGPPGSQELPFGCPFSFVVSRAKRAVVTFELRSSGQAAGSDAERLVGTCSLKISDLMVPPWCPSPQECGGAVPRGGTGAAGGSSSSAVRVMELGGIHTLLKVYVQICPLSPPSTLV